jgi:two-component system chemotaxis response regulator CheB
MKRVRVLVVDDSATIRRLLTSALSRDPEIEVVGTAPEPSVARQMIKTLDPDVITLDVEMPNMNGLDFLERIMRLRPMPVVMVSTLTERGAEVTLQALELGAVDYYAKPTTNVAASLDASAADLCAKVKAASCANVRSRCGRQAASTPMKAGYRPSDKIVAIGASTGGVEALIEVLSSFSVNCPATVIAQHMPARFTASFAQRLDRIGQARVEEATDGAPLQTGRIYLAPGGETHLEIAGRSALHCKLQRSGPVNGHRPSVDVLFKSVAETAGHRALGVILTGMGRDGAVGLRAMRDAGAATIGQDEASSVIYGMPRAAFEIDAVERQLPLDKIGPEIVRLCEAAK